jgi:tetratricopeptide (TPR) repeat protein
MFAHGHFGRIIMSNLQLRFVNDNFLEIDRPHYFGQYARSPNGHFIVTWSDLDDSRGVGGARNKGLGSYLLLNDSKLLVAGKMERPNDGKVADTGIFVLNDWMFSENLNGTFYVISLSGAVLLKKKFKANLLNNGISPDGRIAVCQTCNSDYEADSSILTVFDIERKAVLNQFVPLTGWAKEYKFDLKNNLIFLVYANGKSYRYKFDGTCIDVAQWEKDRELYGSAYDLISIAKTRLENLQSAKPAQYSEIINLLKRALDKDGSDNTKALIHRLLGETYYQCGEKGLAMDHLGNALRLNPKIGVKKMYQSLKSS